MSPRATAWPIIWLVIGLIVSYLYTGLVTGMFAVTGPVPLFLPQAVIISVLLLTPVRGWWLYLLMYYVIQVGQGLATGGREPQFVLVSNLADVVEPLIGALLIRRFALRPRHIFVQFRDVGIYVASVTVGSAVGATLGALNQVLHVNGGSLMP